jgi:hypothetical protein
LGIASHACGEQHTHDQQQLDKCSIAFEGSVVLASRSVHWVIHDFSPDGAVVFLVVCSVRLPVRLCGASFQHTMSYGQKILNYWANLLT